MNCLLVLGTEKCGQGIICLTWWWHTQATDSVWLWCNWCLNTGRVWGSDQHCHVCPTLGTVGKPDWQEPLSTKQSPSELLDEVPCRYVSRATTLAPLDLATGFWRELGAVVASRGWSISLLSVLSLDWICHLSLSLPLGKHRVITLGACVH